MEKIKLGLSSFSDFQVGTICSPSRYLGMSGYIFIATTGEMGYYWQVWDAAIYPTLHRKCPSPQQSIIWPQMLAVSCREPAWGTLPVAKVMRKEAQHTQRRDWASGVPLEILEHLPPKPESAYFTALCSHLHLWLYGGLSPTTISLSEKELTYSSS